MEDKFFMKRALELAEKGWGTTSPNPMVGAVIVKDGRIIGEGYHRKRGEAHAEINALRSVKGSVEGAILYVNLEPCSHYGRTPPCALAVVQSGIKKVVVSMLDPNPLVAGKGIKIMREAGIEVDVGLLEKEARRLNEVFIKYISTPYPFVVQKSAVTLDGKIATTGGKSKWITGEAARGYVHYLRRGMSGIMVGINTVLKDNPSLTARLKGKKGGDPHRIIVDSCGRIPIDSKVITIESDAKTIVATTEKMPHQKEKELLSRGVEIIRTESVGGRVDLEKLMRILHDMEIDGVLLEGGGGINYSMHRLGLVDKVIYFVAPKILGGKDAPTSVEGEGFEELSQSVVLNRVECSFVGEDVVIQGYVRKEG
jgi:diaminohydroxyphosphoribosylaminopyrimidine deaminase/5-amino-6-(5-phosphoribosylamino)uracil reductase